MTEEQRQAEWAVLQSLHTTYYERVAALFADRALVADGSEPPNVDITYGALKVSLTDTAQIEAGRAALETFYNDEIDDLLTAFQTERQTPP
jgi:hypothetical protein